jgi:hypothetical protein
MDLDFTLALNDEDIAPDRRTAVPGAGRHYGPSGARLRSQTAPRLLNFRRRPSWPTSIISRQEVGKKRERQWAWT